MASFIGRARQLSQRLAQNAEAVCRHYLPSGRREGAYWMVGDVHGAAGRSLYVRLHDSGRGRAGNWMDAATGERGDLVDLIHLNQRHARLSESLDEAALFLALPPLHIPKHRGGAHRPARAGSPEAARRLFAASRPVIGSLAADYLRARGIMRLCGLAALRFHPHCHYRPCADDRPDAPVNLPALIATVTDVEGRQTGAHRTFLSPAGGAQSAVSKADVAAPRRAMGHICGSAVRFGSDGHVLIAGEGIETILSLREVLPALPMVAATSSAHLAMIVFPPGLRRLYVARERDAASAAAWCALQERARTAGIELRPLMPVLGDFNDDLRAHGPAGLGARLIGQLHEQDRS